MCRAKDVAWSHAVTSAIRLSSAPTPSLPASAIVLAMSITRAPSASLSFCVRPSAEHRPDEPCRDASAEIALAVLERAWKTNDPIPPQTRRFIEWHTDERIPAALAS